MFHGMMDTLKMEGCADFQAWDLFRFCLVFMSLETHSNFQSFFSVYTLDVTFALNGYFLLLPNAAFLNVRLFTMGD